MTGRSKHDGVIRSTGRLALVTGSGKGIGFGLARGLSQAGAQVVLNGRDETRLAEAARTLRCEGLKIDVAPFDAADHVAVADAVGRIEIEIGPIDILVNNAGMQFRSPLEEFPSRNGPSSCGPTSIPPSLSGRRWPGA
jgi:gluconate 5-dehydrogenase